MLKPPTCEIAAEVVARALLSQGATNLAVKLGMHLAGRAASGWCWETDAAVRLHLQRSDGRMYHRESIGRVRRLMAKRGWIGSKRIMPQQVPDGARFTSPHGTTSKWVIWEVIGARNPMTKGQRKEQRKKQRSEDRRHEDRHVPRGRTGPVAPVFAALVRGIGTPQVPTDVNYKKGPIPSNDGGSSKILDTERPASVRQRDAEANAARQRAELEAWADEHDPPDD